MKLNKVIAIPAIALAAGISLTACGSSHPTVKPAPVTYATANQVVQALKAHHVPVTNAVTDSGLSSFQGATSGVWAVTAPGDSTAVFGGSNNPVQDTEIVVFQNHADAVAYVNIGNTTASPDPDHEAILGTNWAVDAATPAAPSIRAVLGGTLVPTASTSAPAAVATTPAPVVTTPAPPVATTPAAPAMTASEQQAMDAAQNYLSMGEGFSAYSLAQQLTSSAGNGFSPADAAYAINYLNPDWDAQAVDAAQGYMKMGGFSASSLTQQLTSDSGNGFTEAQAAYAVAQVGL